MVASVSERSRSAAGATRRGSTRAAAAAEARPRSAPRTPRAAARRRAAVDRLLDVDLFRAIGEPTRARLLGCLIKCGRPCSVSEVAECCEVDFSVVARHLTQLARAEVLESKKDGRRVLYHAKRDELSAKLRALADAVDEWAGPGADADCCDEAGCERCS